MKQLAALTLLLTVSGVTFAQSDARLDIRQSVSEALAPRIGHVTDVLNARDDARRALESFHEGRRRGMASAEKSGSRQYQVGETREFYVFANDLQSSTRQTRTFELKSASAAAYLWVEVGEISNGHADGVRLSGLAEALLSSTPEGSYNSNQGIIANNNQIFGSPPNVDGDGVVDILLYDIPDQTAGSVLAGFVWSGDLCTTANASTRGCSVSFSNQADVLYLDSHPLLSSFPLETLLEVAAHEYQHLIHFGYDENEETFINEGLSEWAERLNGYRARTITYLSDENERNISLFTWRSQSSDVLKDYQRSSLFTTYLAERVGPELVGSITRRPETGAQGYIGALEGSGVELTDVIADFHVANLINDVGAGSDGRYGYTNPFLLTLRSATSETYTYDGRTITSTPPSTATVKGGGSVYLRWESVEDFTLKLDLSSGTPLDYPKARLRVVVEEAGGGARVEPLELGAETTWAGSFDAITIVAAHVIPVSSAAIRSGVSADRVTFAYEAVWAGGSQIVTELIQYDSGRVDGDFGFYILNSNGEGVVATRFNVPEGGVLDEVKVSPYFLSQFTNGEQTENAPRDFDLRIWADDGAGAPGALLFSKPVADLRDYPAVLQNDYDIRFITVDLSNEPIPPLPDVIYVGYGEAGDDANFLVTAYVNYGVENISFIGVTSGENVNWTRVWDRVRYDEDGMVETSFEGKAIPVRAEFVVGKVVADEDAAELPAQVTLSQNYPNPFNPTTAISFSLPRAEQVRLTVFDVTGRLVTRLVDAQMPAGEHVARLDAGDLASGVYLYVLETESARLTQKMMLVR